MTEDMQPQEPEQPKTFLEKLMGVKEWILGFGVAGLVIWWIIKILICAFAGICLL